METYIAILRGINVSGQKLIGMEGLKIHMQSLGLKNVVTYIQSGNILFKYETIENNNIAKRIEDKILMEYGFSVPTLVKKANEFTNIVLNNPFLSNLKNYPIVYLYATILSEAVAHDSIISPGDIKGNTDEFIISGDVIYLYCPNGYGRTKFSNNFFEKKLKKTATTRNWKTITKLVELANNISD